MTKFKNAFLQMIIEKQHWVNLVWFIQIIAFIFLTCLLIIQHPHGINSNTTDPFINMLSGYANNFWGIMANLAGITTVIADIAFLGIIVWQDEKFNLSQTWRLLPISDGKFYQANVWSTVVSCIIIFIPQMIICLMLIIFETKKKISLITYLFNFSAFLRELTTILLLLTLVLFIITFSSFANFSSRTITDFLPVKNVKFMRIVVLTILIIIATYFAGQINQQIINFANKQANEVVLANKGGLDIWINNISTWYLSLELAISAILFGKLNMWLIKSYIEPKIY